MHNTYPNFIWVKASRSGYMTGEDLSAEKKKLGKMITMIDNALAMREAAPKNAILQVVANKIEKMEGLKKKPGSCIRLAGGFFRGCASSPAAVKFKFIIFLIYAGYLVFPNCYCTAFSALLSGGDGYYSHGGLCSSHGIGGRREAEIRQ